MGPTRDPRAGRRHTGVTNNAAVSLVIPGLNCARTLRPCLEAVTAILNAAAAAAAAASPLREIIFVDDGSSDETPDVAREFPVKVISGPGGGPGAARNLGWRAAESPLIWFVDSDCVAEPDALLHLLPHLDDPAVCGVSGSYGIMNPESLLACLVHEEIIERHRQMATEVNFLGGFNVLYRRSAVEEVAGFDEQWFNGPGKPGAEDADLAYRVRERGHVLHFEPRSLVKHFHPSRLGRYLRSQRIHGWWRVNLHLRHVSQGAGDSYSRVIDHLQPPVAMLTLASLPLLFIDRGWIVPASLVALLLLAQLPMTLRILKRLRRTRYLLFAPLGFLRAYWRGAGLTMGLLAAALSRRRREMRSGSASDG